MPLLLLAGAFVFLAAASKPAASKPEQTHDNPKAAAIQRLRFGKPWVAEARLRGALAKDPDDAELHAMHGVADVEIGDLAGALVDFSFGSGNDYYEQHALDSHANALRFLGPTGAAAELRTSELWAEKTPLQELVAYLELVDDCRSDGNLDAAWEAALMAVAIAPDRAGPHAQLSQVLMDLGSWDEARSELWLAERDGQSSSYVALAVARILVHDGEISAALDRAIGAHKKARNDLMLLSLRAEMTVLSGNPETALELLHRNRFEQVTHPAAVIAELHALRQTGGAEEEAKRWKWALGVFGNRRLLGALGPTSIPAEAPPSGSP